MITDRRRALSVCFLLAMPLLLGAAAFDPPTWIVNINTPVTSPGTLTVRVAAAPEYPVEVVIRCGGHVVHTGTINAANGSVSWTVPIDKSGDTWEVRLGTSGGDRWNDSGVIQ